MGMVIGWLVERGLSEKMARFVAIAGLFLLLLGMAGGVLALIRKDAVDDHQAKVEQRARPATDAAAAQRATDAITDAKNDKERHDVIAAQPDQPIAPTSHALSCKRLHDAGKHPPACR